MLAESKKRDKDRDTFGIFSSANAGEFELCTDHFEKINGVDVPCLKKETIRQFYKDSLVLFPKVINGELPVKKPRLKNLSSRRGIIPRPITE